MKYGKFVWHLEKEAANIEKHGISFTEASTAFLDEMRLIAKDELHSETEERYFCIGKVNKKVITVRFVYRSGKIRIIGAGSWRKGTKLYEKEKIKSKK